MISTSAKILFVSYYCDPHNLTATRNFFLSQYLANAGHEVHIISKTFTQSKRLKKIQYHLVDAWDYRKLLIRLGVRDGVTSTMIPPGRWIQWGFKLLLRYPFNKWLGEGGSFYYRQAVRIGFDVVKENHITHLFSSYRPMADHFIAERIKINFPGLIWIGDFRDVLWWEKNNIHYQEKWIRRLISNMDHLTAVTSGIGSFWGDVFSRSFTTIYNGLPLDRDQLNIEQTREKKFTINYTGRIYAEFQRADMLWQLLKELTITDPSFADDLCISYSGISNRLWAEWMEKAGLSSFSRINHQVPVVQAWKDQAHAQINLLLTWTTPDITGFIHGKFNEYLAMRKPILCLINGGVDEELEKIYTPLTNSLVVYHVEADRHKLREFILKNYQQWKSNSQVEELPLSVLDDFQWKQTGLPLLKLIQTPL